jgi:hypothetical protein
VAFKYESVVPWGRSYEEYIKMFSLSEKDLTKKILGCGDGPAGFNSIINKNGGYAVSIDPIYKFSKEEIEKRIEETYDNVISQTRKNQEKFIWTKIKDVDELGRIRMSAMKIFLEDYEKGKDENRYVYGELPNLSFDDNQFDISLSSHFLFLYTDNLTLDFHIKSIREMLRVSFEARIFPLLDVNARLSVYVPEVMNNFNNGVYSAEIIKVDYEFQKGGNEMMVIKRNKNIG